MLGERERRDLREIEQRLAQQDQRFAAAMSRPLPGRRSRWLRRVYDATIALAGLLAVTCLTVTPTSTAGAGTVAVLFTAGAIYLRRRRFPRPVTADRRTRT